MQLHRILLVCFSMVGFCSGAVEHSTIEYPSPVKQIRGRILGWGMAGSNTQVSVFTNPEIRNDTSLSFNQQRSRQRLVQTVQTKDDREFKFRSLPKGTYEVEFSQFGWDPLSLIIRVDPSSSPVELCVRLRISDSTMTPSVENCSATYHNEEYGITLPVPSGALLCRVPNDARGIDHGAQLLLGTKDATLCRKDSGKRYMDVFAAYNVADDTKLLHDLLESSCQSETKKPCSPAPTYLTIAGMKTEAGRLDGPNGFIRIIVATQAGKPDPDGDASVPSINYKFNLITDAQHLEEDLNVFRAMLKSVRIAPD